MEWMKHPSTCDYVHGGFYKIEYDCQWHICNRINAACTARTSGIEPVIYELTIIVNNGAKQPALKHVFQVIVLQFGSQETEISDNNP